VSDGRDERDTVLIERECRRGCADSVVVAPSRMVLVLFVMACHGTAAPVTSPQPERACAPALPLLASQHTPNATRIYLAP
jgi:hypothetical protein